MDFPGNQPTHCIKPFYSMAIVLDHRPTATSLTGNSGKLTLRRVFLVFLKGQNGSFLSVCVGYCWIFLIFSWWQRSVHIKKAAPWNVKQLVCTGSPKMHCKTFDFLSTLFLHQYAGDWRIASRYCKQRIYDNFNTKVPFKYYHHIIISHIQYLTHLKMLIGEKWSNFSNKPTSKNVYMHCCTPPTFRSSTTFISLTYMSKRCTLVSRVFTIRGSSRFFTVHIQVNSPFHRLTLPKGVYSLRYFLSPMRILNLAMHLYTWAVNKRIWCKNCGRKYLN